MTLKWDPPGDRIIRRINWTSWAGTLEDIQASAQLIVESITEWSNEPARYFRAEVELWNGLAFESNRSVDVLTALRPDDVARVSSVRVDIGAPLGPVGGSISLHIHSAEVPGAHYSGSIQVMVSGFDRTKVEGLATRVEGIMDRGKRRSSLFTSSSRWVWQLAAAVAGFGGATAILAEGYAVRAAGVALTLLGLLGSGAIFRLPLLPAVELLLPGQEPRRIKYRRLALGAIWAVLVAVIGSIVAAIVLRG